MNIKFTIETSFFCSYYYIYDRFSGQYLDKYKTELPSFNNACKFKTYTHAYNTLHEYYMHEFGKIFYMGCGVNKRKALLYANNLKLISSDFNNDCVIQISDGGLQFYHCVAVQEFKDYILVIPEHHEISVHNKEEVDFWNVYPNKQVKNKNIVKLT